MLLVKDDPEQVTLFTLLLTQSGYDVVAVPSGEAALLQSVTPPFDVLLTDLHLSGMSGDTLICTWQTHSPLTKTILMSGDPDVSIAAAACGADGWFRKPFEAKHLRDLVAAVISTSLLVPE